MVYHQKNVEFSTFTSNKMIDRVPKCDAGRDSALALHLFANDSIKIFSLIKTIFRCLALLLSFPLRSPVIQISSWTAGLIGESEVGGFQNCKAQGSELIWFELRLTVGLNCITTEKASAKKKLRRFNSKQNCNVMWQVWLQTCEAVHPLWYTECVQEGREERLGQCVQASFLTPGFHTLIAPPPCCVPSLWGNHPGILQTTHTRAPGGGCGTATPNRIQSLLQL